MQQKDIISARRKQLGLTQLQVAHAVGVSEATVSRWESGDIAEVGSSKIPALARVLDMEPAQLLGQDDSLPPSAAQPPPAAANRASHSRASGSAPSELDEYLEQLRTRPEMRMFFSLAKDATKSEVEDAARIVEAYFAGRQAGQRQRKAESDEEIEQDDEEIEQDDEETEQEDAETEQEDEEKAEPDSE